MPEIRRQMPAAYSPPKTQLSHQSKLIIIYLLIMLEKFVLEQKDAQKLYKIYPSWT